MRGRPPLLGHSCMGDSQAKFNTLAKRAAACGRMWCCCRRLPAGWAAAVRGRGGGCTALPQVLVSTVRDATVAVLYTLFGCFLRCQERALRLLAGRIAAFSGRRRPLSTQILSSCFHPAPSMRLFIEAHRLVDPWRARAMPPPCNLESWLYLSSGQPQATGPGSMPFNNKLLPHKPAALHPPRLPLALLPPGPCRCGRVPGRKPHAAGTQFTSRG